MLHAALPRVVRERQERKAGYEESKQQAARWTPLVKANREAATVCLTADNDVPRVTTAASLAAKHENVSSFEAEVAQLLRDAGHDDVRKVSEVRELAWPRAPTAIVRAVQAC